MSDHEESFERDEGEGNVDDNVKDQSGIDLKLEEEKEGGETSSIKEEKKAKPVPAKARSTNTTVKLSVSARIKKKDRDNAPESPLPRILINNDLGAMEGTDEETPAIGESERAEYALDEDMDTSRQFNQKKKETKKKKEQNLYNLKSKYDGFNRLRFVYSRVIPKCVEETDFILP
jgi:hypothetical protein